MGNSSVSTDTRFGVALHVPAGPMQVAALGDVNSNVLRTADAGVGDGTSYLGGAVTLITLPSAAYTSAVPAACTVSTDGITYGALDITLTAFTGGSAPTIQYYLERQGADGAWYQLLTTGALNSAPQTISIDISPGLSNQVQAPLTSTSQHAVFSHTARLRWVLAGSVAPTSVTFSASLIGR